MKISIHTTITNPEDNQYPWREALSSYLAFADEVVIVDGFSTDGSLQYLEDFSKNNRKIKIINLYWPQDKWDWSELPKHLNAGLDACTGDIAIKFDIDYIMHEKNMDDIKKQLKKVYDFKMIGASLVKFIVLNKNLGYQKCMIPFCLNKSILGDTAKYGEAIDEKTDHCYPIRIKEKINDIYIGKAITENMLYRIGENIFCYDYFFRTVEKAKERFWKFAKAYIDDSWGATPEQSWKKFKAQELSRLEKAQHKLKIKDHPIFIREAIKNLNSEIFGFNNWNKFENV